VRWYSKEQLDPVPVPVLGPDLMDPREYELIKQYSAEKLVVADQVPEADQA
jgi:NADH-quinone oxidoreductase subunit B